MVREVILRANKNKGNPTMTIIMMETPTSIIPCIRWYKDSVINVLLLFDTTKALIDTFDQLNKTAVFFGLSILREFEGDLFFIIGHF